MNETASKEKIEENDNSADNVVTQKSDSTTDMKPLKRQDISSEKTPYESEKEALCGGQPQDSKSYIKHPTTTSLVKKERKHNSDPTFVRRVGSTATTDKSFERPASQLGSRKSLASVKTRTASVTRSEYHADLKSGLKAVSFLLVTHCFNYCTCLV